MRGRRQRRRRLGLVGEQSHRKIVMLDHQSGLFEEASVAAYWSGREFKGNLEDFGFRAVRGRAESHASCG
eukprot:7211617-Prymnesium_polylepis.1